MRIFSARWRGVYMSGGWGYEGSAVGVCPMRAVLHSPRRAHRWNVMTVTVVVDGYWIRPEPLTLSSRAAKVIRRLRED